MEKEEEQSLSKNKKTKDPEQTKDIGKVIASNIVCIVTGSLVMVLTIAWASLAWLPARTTRERFLASALFISSGLLIVCGAIGLSLRASSRKIFLTTNLFANLVTVVAALLLNVVGLALNRFRIFALVCCLVLIIISFGSFVGIVGFFLIDASEQSLAQEEVRPKDPEQVVLLNAEDQETRKAEEEQKSAEPPEEKSSAKK